MASSRGEAPAPLHASVAGWARLLLGSPAPLAQLDRAHLPHAQDGRRRVHQPPVRAEGGGDEVGDGGRARVGQRAQEEGDAKDGREGGCSEGMVHVDGVQREDERAVSDGEHKGEELGTERGHERGGREGGSEARAAWSAPSKPRRATRKGEAPTKATPAGIMAT